VAEKNAGSWGKVAGKVITRKQECGRKETGRWQEGNMIKLGKG